MTCFYSAHKLTLPMPDNPTATKYTWDAMPREQVTEQLSRRLITGD